MVQDDPEELQTSLNELGHSVAAGVAMPVRSGTSQGIIPHQCAAPRARHPRLLLERAGGRDDRSVLPCRSKSKAKSVSVSARTAMKGEWKEWSD
jgi:hypothetical protein